MKRKACFLKVTNACRSKIQNFIVVAVQFIIKSDKYNDMIQARFWNSKKKSRQKSNI